MTDAAFSSAVPLDERVRALSSANGASVCVVAAPPNALDKESSPVKTDATVPLVANNANNANNANSANNANNAPPPNALRTPSSDDANADFVDDAGKIDWNAALSANESLLRSTIATRVGENAAVDEVFQDVALAATRQQAPIRDPRKIGAWLRRLATVYSLLYRRSIGRKKKLLQRYQDRVPVCKTSGVDADPLRWLLLEERRALVREATARLSDEERRVLTLKYAEERSYKEIAEEIGSTVSAVQSKLHRARARLRENLAELAPLADEPPT